MNKSELIMGNRRTAELLFQPLGINLLVGLVES